jgi:hypothetical protein
MKIINDIIEFEPADFGLLSPRLQTALQLYAGTNLDKQGNPVVPGYTLLSNVCNEVLRNAVTALAKADLDTLKTFSDALAVANDIQRQQAFDLLTQAGAVLNVVIEVPPVVVPVDKLPPVGVTAAP